MVHPVLRDETNAMAATRTPKRYPEASKNCLSGLREVHPKIGYLCSTDYIWGQGAKKRNLEEPGRAVEDSDLGGRQLGSISK